MLREVARVLEPGGRLFVTEPDLRSLSLSASDPAVMRSAVDAWSRELPNPDAGRRLQGWLEAAGLHCDEAHTREVVHESLAVFEKLTDFMRISRARDPVDGATESFLRGLETDAERGRFCARYELISVAARKQPVVPRRS